MAFAVVKNCTKIGLAGGAVYWSYQQGVWGTPDEGFVAMKRLSDAIVPPSQELVERVVKEVNTDGSIAAATWNKGAKVMCESLLEVPHTFGSYANQAGTVVSKLVSDSMSSK